MSRRFRLKKGGPLKKRHVMLIILILLTLMSVIGFLLVEKNLEPALKEIARTYVKQIATLAINDAISKKINEEMDEIGHLHTIEKSSEGDIQLISLDSAKQAKIVTLVTERANQILMELYKEPIQLPLGQALNSNILAQLGPDIPITLQPMGAAKADIYVDLKEAGINTVAIVTMLSIEADVRIVIPFSSDEALVKTELPVSVDILPGEIPDYYFQSGEDGEQRTPLPNISLPRVDE